MAEERGMRATGKGQSQKNKQKVKWGEETQEELTLRCEDKDMEDM